MTERRQIGENAGSRSQGSRSSFGRAILVDNPGAEKPQSLIKLANLISSQAGRGLARLKVGI